MNLNVIIVFNIILLFVFGFTIYLHAKKTEMFQSKTEYHIVDNNNNISNAYDIDKNVYHKSIMNLKKQGYFDKKSIGLNDGKIILYIDPYLNYYVLGNKDDNILDYKDGIFVCLSFTKLNSSESVWNLENKIVAYNYVSDYLFVQALIKAYRLDITKIKLVKIDDKDLKQVDKIFDLFFTYVVIDSRYMKMLESSLYYINSMIDVDINRLLPFYPFIRENYKSMREYFSKDTIKEYIYNDAALIPLMNYQIITFDETFITRLKLPEDYIGIQKISGEQTQEYTNEIIGYGCYGNQKIHNMYECNSEYNINGTKKTYYSLWDKQCSSNDECPFYKANTKYINERGGCKNGLCEFPLGIKRLGFMQYDNKGINAPFCYECSNTRDLDCCNKIKNPDYVFANDRQDRLNNNLQSIIDQIDYSNY
jgi:competence protein ComGC